MMLFIKQTWNSVEYRTLQHADLKYVARKCQWYSNKYVYTVKVNAICTNPHVKKSQCQSCTFLSWSGILHPHIRRNCIGTHSLSDLTLWDLKTS